jgi:hypothetical protein
MLEWLVESSVYGRLCCGILIVIFGIIMSHAKIKVAFGSHIMITLGVFVVLLAIAIQANESAKRNLGN